VDLLCLGTVAKERNALRIVPSYHSVADCPQMTPQPSETERRIVFVRAV
jgi:hypothetical protein